MTQAWSGMEGDFLHVRVTRKIVLNKKARLYQHVFGGSMSMKVIYDDMTTKPFMKKFLVRLTFSPVMKSRVVGPPPESVF